MNCICNRCGKTFEARTLKDRFCSGLCQRGYFTAFYKSGGQNTAKSLFSRFCHYCKKPYKPKTASQKYCCEQCEKDDKFIKDNMKGDIFQEYQTMVKRGKESINKIDFIKMFVNRTCAYCGCKLIIGNNDIRGNLTVDHIVPISEYGVNSGNLVLCCKSCNSGKKDMTAEKYIEYLQENPDIVLERNRKAAELCYAIEEDEKFKRKLKRKLTVEKTYD